MLIGSNMPIFGGGTHPCVSLRLREKNNPINVLTGLDYWLDNLMCNVPEVVMCYHLNGIVQKYEFLKTEDIPQLENCRFSPKLVKDIAQNILSFLKTNATKAGHTYWLFKGKDEDVVKLYDLSSLCEDYLMEDKEQNPFAMHVALLLHTVARSLYSQQCNDKQRKTMHILLKHCISLLDAMKHPQVVTSSHYLLADLYLLSNEHSEELTESDQTEDDSIRDDVYFPSNSSTNEDIRSSQDKSIETQLCQSSSVEVEALCLAHKPLSEHDDQNWLDQKIEMNYLDRCNLALEHIAKGLTYVDESLKELNRTDRNRRATKEEVQAMAKPFQPIPLRYFPLDGLASTLTNKETSSSSNIEKSHKSPARYTKHECGKHNQSCWMSYTHKTKCPLSHVPWQCVHKIHLLKKAAIALSLSSENSVIQNGLGLALRYLQSAILCLEAAQSLLSMYELNDDDTNQILQKCLYLAGDIHHKLGLLNEISDAHLQQFNALPELLQTITNSAKLVHEQGFSSYDYIWKIGMSNREHFEISIACYKEILSIHESKEDFWKCKQRIGSTYNELAVKLMVECEVIFQEQQCITNKLKKTWKESNVAFLEGIDALREIENTPNLALVTSNLGRLIRLYAHFLRGNKQKEFETEERRYYQKAIKCYEDALKILNNREEHPAIWDTIMWEYSTTCFSMANLLQDYAPLSNRAQEDVEKEIIQHFTRALRFCDITTPGPRQPVCQYRAATIHQRIGSLYHNAIRNEVVENGHKRKDYSARAEEHYDNAASLFQTIERLPEVLRVLLEHVGMHDFLLQNKTGFSSRFRTLHRMLEILLRTKEAIRSMVPTTECGTLQDKTIKVPSQESNASTSQDPEQEEIHKLLLIIFDQLQVTLLKLTKLHSGKKGHQQKGELYKKMYSISASVSSCDLQTPIQTVQFLYSAMEKLRCLLPNLGSDGRS